MPVYAYLFNGGSNEGFADVNNQPGGMIHIEPTLGGITLLGSYYASRYDNKELNALTKWSAGIIYKWEGLTLRSEFVKSRKERDVSISQDTLNEGYIVKMFYKVLPGLQLMMHHESVLESQGIAGKATRYIQKTPGMQIFLSDSAVIVASVDILDYRTTDNKTTLVATRPLVGLRVTF